MWKAADDFGRCKRLQLLNRNGVSQRERAGLRSPQCGEMSAASCKLSQLVRDGPDISARRNMHREACKLCLQRLQREPVNRDSRRLHGYILARARKLMRGHAADLLRRIHWRHLVNRPVKARCE